MPIRSLTLMDAPALAALDALCFGSEAWSTDALASSLALPTTTGMAWEEGGQIIGFYLVQKTEGETEILTLGVHPEFRRRGTGRAMLAHILHERGAEGVVFLDVAEDNHAAQRLYESCGFKVFSRRSGYYRRADSAVDALNYRCII